jgi:putative ABC transport system substrate-binding protein
MRRREFIAATGTTVIAGLQRTTAEQTASAFRHPLIGILALDATENDARLINEFMAELARLGYADRKSATIVHRYAAFKVETLPALAVELAALHPDVILADTASPIKAARAAAPTVPIVGATMAYPIEQGLIQGFAHPGGTVTGLASQVDAMDVKLIELIIETLPSLKSIGLLLNPDATLAVLLRRSYESATAKRGIELHVAEAHHPSEIEPAIQALAAAGISALALQPNAVFLGERRHIAELALATRVPCITSPFDPKDMVAAGIMMDYGVDYPALYRRAAVFVDKILKGASPSDLPIEFPTELQLGINLKTAKALGIAIPQSVLLRATEVIE